MAAASSRHAGPRNRRLPPTPSATTRRSAGPAKKRSCRIRENSMAEPLKGKIAIVTGSGRGIGRTMALALLDAGAKVMFNDMDKAPLAATLKEAKKRGGDRVHGVQADVSKFAQ